MSMNTKQQQQQQRQREASPAEIAYLQKQAAEQQILNAKLNEHVQSYPIHLLFPAVVSSLPDENQFTASDGSGSAGARPGVLEGSTTKKPLRTSSDFINYRLLETEGLDFTPDANESYKTDDTSGPNNDAMSNNADAETTTSSSSSSSSSATLAQTFQALNNFVQDLQSTNCYESVQVVLGNQDNDSTTNISDGGDTDVRPKKLNVILNEKNWYKLYIGGGIKHDNTSATTGSLGMTTFPKVQFESSASLINLSGLTDYTQCSYTIDQTSTPTVSFTHTRPLYSLFDANNSTIGDMILNMNHGSKLGITFRANVDTLDYEHTRSSKDHIQTIGMKIANSTSHSSSMNSAMSEDVYVGFDWSLSHREIIPRRSTTSPFLCDASADIIACSGQSLKHAVSVEYRMNGVHTDSKYNPTVGVDSYGGVEIAGPPGDVGFLKWWSGGSVHLPLGDSDSVPTKRSGGFFSSILPKGLSLHTSYSCGMIKHFSYGGLCMSGGDMTNISDRFYIGGPHQLRGFLPAGIGPRSDEGGKSVPGGDSVGGDVYYTTIAMLSAPFPGNNPLSRNGVRLFGFANAGTLTGLHSAVHINTFLGSTRYSVGGGISAATPMGRLEASYAVPMRYGPRDARRSVQLGFGLTFG